MNSVEKQRILAAYERASLIAALANRGIYLFGEKPTGSGPVDDLVGHCPGPGQSHPAREAKDDIEKRG